MASAESLVHVVDLTAQQSYVEGDPGVVDAVELGGVRTLLMVPMLKSKRPTNPALAVHCRAWEVCSVIGKLVSTHDDGYGFGWPGASAEMDDL
jgi:hypothetical protein